MEQVLNKYSNFVIDASLFFKSLFEETDKVSIIIMSAKGIILECNTAFMNEFGYTKDDLQGEHFSMLFVEEDKKTHAPEIELGTVLSKGAAGDMNFLLRKNGEQVWVYGESILAKAENDFIIKIIFNIDEQKKLEEVLSNINSELQKSEEYSFRKNQDFDTTTDLPKINNDIKQLLLQKRHQAELYETILSNSADFIYCFDLKGRFTYANKALLEFWGLRPEYVIGKTLKELYYPEELLEKHSKQIQTVISTKEPVRDEYFYKGKLQTRFYEHILVPVLEEGEIKGVAGTTRDITHRYELERDLLTANEGLISVNQDLDNFVYTASHDLKAPLSNIQGLFDALEWELRDYNNEDTRNLLQMIRGSIEKFQAVLRDMSTTVREKNEDVEVVDLSEMIEETKVNLHDLIKKNNPVIIANVKNAPTVRFSRKNLRSILQNLISNAIKYHSLERKPEVRIETEETDNYFVLKVSDNGLGIKDVDKEKVFRIYNRLHQHVEGSGVGMAIVARIVNGNGGKIEIESEEGKGSIFKVFLRV